MEAWNRVAPFAQTHAATHHLVIDECNAGNKLCIGF